MVHIYDFQHKAPHCPSCDKPLEYDLVAKDFVVCDMNGNPKSQVCEDRCGWCDVAFVAYLNQDRTKIVFKPKY